MRVLTIAGKVDTRVLVYPLARALSLTGLTAIVTDDGAYRRLFKGKQLTGTVSGVDISVGLNMNEELRNSLSKSGIPYDNLIVVSSNYIPKDSDGIIICHGFDDSLGQEIEEDKPVEIEEPKPKKKKGLNKKKDNTTEEETPTEVISLEKVEPVIIKEIDEDDTFDIPDNIPVTEIFISYNKPIDKYAKGILLKDGYMQYIYSCEERKVLDRFMDKSINKYIASIVSPVIDIETKELEMMLSRLEYNNNKKKKVK